MNYGSVIEAQAELHRTSREQEDRSVEKGQDFLEKEAERLMLPEVNWDEYLEPEERAKVRDAGSYRDSVKHAFLSPEEAKGLRLPWSKATEFRFRPGELTIWTGYNGHRKSMMIGYVLLGLRAQEAKSCIASLEMKPTTTLKRMCSQYVGTHEPTVPYIGHFFDWLENHVYLYDQMGTVKTERMIAVARYAITELNVTHFVIDSLMKCGIQTDRGYDKQNWFIDELSTLAKDTGAHIHLVAHAKKPEGNKEVIPSSKYTVKGSGDITDMADNVVVVFVDREEEDDTKTLFLCQKQREGEGEPGYQLHFDKSSLQFKGHESAYKMSPDDWMNQRWQ